MRITVIGTGYVGLVTGACLAELGHDVACVDKERAKIDTLNSGHLPIYEPELAEIVAHCMQEGRLSFSSDLAPCVARSEAVFITVGTPSRAYDGCADLTYVYAAARELAPVLPESAVVIVKSTVPVGTGDEVERIINEMRPAASAMVASNPEFLRAGSAVRDFKHPDRIVVGSEDADARACMADIYRPFERRAAPILYTSRRTAELIKYASNAFLATKVTFINEVSDLCEKVGAEVKDVARGMGLDNRIGPSFLDAGPGFGGSCFPKDAVALAKLGQDNEAPLHIVETVIAVNQTRKRAMARKVAAALGGSLRDKTVALLGLTFKPDTDDMREAPSIVLATALVDMGARLRAYDPAGMKRAKALLPPLRYCRNAYEAAEGADAVVVVTEWDQFRVLDFARLKRRMARPVLVDFRGIYRASDLTEHGFVYHRLGSRRPPLQAAAPVAARKERRNARTTPLPERALPAPELRRSVRSNGGARVPALES
jgi:UDPglucose 6-dehydrogenase